MKILVFSDVHGSAHFCNKILNQYHALGCDKAVLLGDVYYHGPRNPLPQGHDPMQVANLLNNFDGDLVVVKGNCDAEVDQMISHFTFKASHTQKVGARKVFFTHGHKWHEKNLPTSLKEGDVLFHGHTHVGGVKVVRGILVANPGSVSLPKDGCNSFAVIDEKEICFYDVNGKSLGVYKF
ncbi:MAG: phosphodiesterase [Clostridia bacterium]|nr:phosphodiesterase [Clostridia bacterium]